MSALTAGQVEELRGELERELVRLRRSMSTTGEAARPVALDQSAIGRLSRVDAMANQQLQKDLHERERALEEHMMAALRRVEDGSYGRCATCGGGVPYGRLLVMPEARTCATCGRV